VLILFSGYPSHANQRLRVEPFELFTTFLYPGHTDRLKERRFVQINGSAIKAFLLFVVMGDNGALNRRLKVPHIIMTHDFVAGHIKTAGVLCQFVVIFIADF
jgi:hypothetical protein